MIELQNIRKVFGAGTPDEKVLFDDFNLTIRDGSFVSVIGSNGSGKTTLLNLICGAMTPDQGRVVFNGTDVTAWPVHRRAQRIGRVFQDPQKGVCGELTVLENLALADNKGKAYSLGRAVNRARIDSYRERLAVCNMGLENRLYAQVKTLSGGQRQALALVLLDMSDADLFIMDEHTAALDPRSSETVMELTDRLVRERSVTTLMVTHNLRFAVEYGDRLIMMHEGKAVVDIEGEEKAAVTVDHLLSKFNEISIECGN